MQNGKLDRAALPEPGNQTSAEKTAPRTPLETQLLGIWQEVLERDDLGVTDNFFEAGGHSLLALKVLARGAQAGMASLTLEALFQHATVRTLAAYLGARDGSVEPAANVVSLSERTDAPIVFAIHPASGLVADYRPLAERSEE